jgi:hypothetical protein
MSLESLDVEEEQISPPRVMDFRDLLKQLFKLGIKFSNSLILRFLAFGKSSQHHAWILFSTPPFKKGFLKLIHSLDALIRETLIPSPSSIGKSG